MIINSEIIILLIIFFISEFIWIFCIIIHFIYYKRRHFQVKELDFKNNINYLKKIFIILIIIWVIMLLFNIATFYELIFTSNSPFHDKFISLSLPAVVTSFGYLFFIRPYLTFILEEVKDKNDKKLKKISIFKIINYFNIFKIIFQNIYVLTLILAIDIDLAFFQSIVIINFILMNYLYLDFTELTISKVSLEIDNKIPINKRKSKNLCTINLIVNIYIFIINYSIIFLNLGNLLILNPTLTSLIYNLSSNLIIFFITLIIIIIISYKGFKKISSIKLND